MDAERLVPILVDAAVKGFAILLIATVAALLMRRASAAARHMVWLLAVLGMLALPAMSALLPAWSALPPLPLGEGWGEGARVAMKDERRTSNIEHPTLNGDPLTSTLDVERSTFDVQAPSQSEPHPLPLPKGEGIETAARTTIS